MARCDKCQNKAWCYDGNHELTRHGCTENNWCCFQRITNADRIRSMTDEELADYLDGVCHDLWQMFVADPQKMWLDWLKKEAIDGNSRRNPY